MPRQTCLDTEKVLQQHSLFLAGDSNGRRATLCGANLRGVNLGGAELPHADLSYAHLRGASLHEANLVCATLRGANLREADLRGANLHEASLHEASLRGADLAYAKLRHVDLHEADLHGANLRGANLCGTVGNMKEVKSLQTELFPCTWIQPPDGETIVQIGCQQHTLRYWKRVTEAEISSHGGSWDDWQRLWPHVLALIEASPAVPYGAGKGVE